VTDIQTQLENSVVRPIFGSLPENGAADQSLPPVVLANRKERAYKRVLDALVSRGVPSVPSDLRSRLQSIIETWSLRAFQDGFEPIQELEVQCARERQLAIARQSGDPKRVLSVMESEYRRRVVERFGSIELKGIQLNHRVILDLDQVYIPLHLGQPEEGILGLRIRVAVREVLGRHTRVLLIGSPGSGKTTLVSFLASKCAIGNHYLGWPERALPFVITVRELKDAEFTQEWLAARVGVDVEVVSAALLEERAVLLIDGLDEAPEELRRQLTTAVVQFYEKYPRVPIMVTSRPAGAPGEAESSLGCCVAFRLADLTDQEVDEFVDKWCLAAERSARADEHLARKEATAAAMDLRARIRRSRPVQRIAVNPLLTTILCVVHRYLGRTIPEHRVTLYEKCTDALLYEWDRAKFPKDSAVGDLDANQKRALLKGIASFLHEKHEAEIAEPDVVRHFAAMLPEMGKPQEDALRIVREIRDRSGLLVERRPGVFSFSHLTFQEYFTALDYISRPVQLLAHVDQPWWDEVIALAAGVPTCDAGRLIHSLLDKGATILAAKCLETAVNVPMEVRKQVELALEQSLPGGIGTESLVEIGLIVAPILTRLLPSYDSHGKTYSLLFFHDFHYDPVVPTLLSLLADENEADCEIALVDEPRPMNIAEMSAVVLRKMAPRSETARQAFASVLERPWEKEFHTFLRQGLIDSSSDKPSSKPARSTPRRQPSKPRQGHARLAK
jgi:hypothetical protein